MALVDMQETMEVLEESAIAKPPSIMRLLQRQASMRDSKVHGDLARGRRESFLQERKDRLAARRARVDQVLARKHAQADVTAKLAALRESLSSAQAARSAIYSRIAAHGSREVAHAQSVARRNKEKLKQEREAKRSALEVKLAAAGKRRQLALDERTQCRRSVSPRGRRSQKGSFQVPGDAATVIQRCWRKNLLFIRAKRFKAHHLNHSIAAEVPFEVIADTISQKNIIECSILLLKSLGLLQTANAAKQNIHCRLFLSSFMIVGHPDVIFSNRTALEEQLIVLAKDFAMSFTACIGKILRKVFVDLTRLQQVWQLYVSAFEAWKRKDSANLLELMVAQYCELDLIYQIVKSDSDPIVAADYHAAIRENQVMLLTRIRRIAGDKTRSIIKSAVIAARRKRSPRAKAPKLEDAVQFFAVGQRQTRLSNRQIIHELALDPSFQIGTLDRSHEEGRSEEAMKANFLKSLQIEMRAGNLQSWVPIIVQECKMRLLRLVMPDSPTFNAITAAFNVPTIEAECQSGEFDYIQFTTTTIDMMQALCAPHRDCLVKEIKSLSGKDNVQLFASRVNAIFECLDILLLDSANFHLGISAPKLIPQAAQYESKLFAADLEKGLTTLLGTKAWLDPFEGTLPDRYQAALARLLISDISIPETLHLDIDRINTYRSRITSCRLTELFLISTKSVMHRKLPLLNPITWTSLTERLSILLPENIIGIAAEINKHLDIAYLGEEADRVERHSAINNMIDRVMSNTDPVNLLVHRRVESALLESIRGEGITGLEYVHSILSQLSPKINALSRVNYDTYKSFYASIGN